MLPLCRRLFPNWFRTVVRIRWTSIAGIVHEDVDPPKACDRFACHRFDACKVRDVSLPRHRHAAEGLDFVCDSLRAVDVKRSEEHTSELQSLMRISYAVFCLKKKITYT